MSNKGSAGNQGPEIRSDCFAALELTTSGGIEISLNSKVDALYKQSIQDLAHQILDFFQVKDARLDIVDRGALPFVLAARIEAAIKDAEDKQEEFWPEMIPENQYQTEKDQPRRSRLYLPGNTPRLMLNAGIHKPDGVILDLEDSVAPDKKEQARLVVRNALRQVNFYGAERMVRINQLPLGLEDFNLRCSPPC